MKVYSCCKPYTYEFKDCIYKSETEEIILKIVKILHAKCTLVTGICKRIARNNQRSYVKVTTDFGSQTEKIPDLGGQQISNILNKTEPNRRK